MESHLLCDGVSALWPLATGAAGFGAGMALRRAGWALKLLATTAFVLATLLTFAYQLEWLLPDLCKTLSVMGGSVVLSGWLLLTLLGYHWMVSTSPRAFRVGLLVVLFLVMAIETSGRPWFGWIRSDVAHNYPDGDGLLRQSTLSTCGPCAVALWLQCHEIRASEGELAHLCRTSPLFGTREWSLAWALEQRLGPSYRAGVLVQSWEAWQDRAPFIGFIHIGMVGVHAVLIEQMDANGVTMSDPLRGERVTLPRSYFETLWRGKGILLRRTAHGSDDSGTMKGN